MDDEKKDKQNNRDEWMHMVRIGTTVFVTFVLCILFFFVIYRYQGFADGWNKIISALQPIIIGLAYVVDEDYDSSAAEDSSRPPIKKDAFGNDLQSGTVIFDVPEILKTVARYLVAPLVKSVIAQKDCGLVDAIEKVADSAFSAQKTLPDGTFANNEIGLLEFNGSFADFATPDDAETQSYMQYQCEYLYKILPLRAVSDIIGEENLFFFTFSLFSDPMTSAFAAADGAHAADYAQRCGDYVEKLSQLDAEFQDVVERAVRKTVVFADRFPLRYFAAGVVTAVVDDEWGGGYGRHLLISHGNGVQTLYGHCNKLNAYVGQEVSQGQVIGYVGSTGRSSGNHLHLEIRVNGVAQDPQNYLY